MQLYIALIVPAHLDYLLKLTFSIKKIHLIALGRLFPPNPFFRTRENFLCQQLGFLAWDRGLPRGGSGQIYLLSISDYNWG